MVDLYDDDVSHIQQEHEDILNDYLISTSEFKPDSSKSLYQTPEEVEAFMLMIKCFANLIFALFGVSIPFYSKLK